VNVHEWRRRELEKESATPNELVVLWTSGDREVALKMAFMYTLNSKLKGWWKDVTLIVWGPSSKLISLDTELQAHLVKMKEAGVKFMACKACSDMYGVSSDLEKLGIEVKYMGAPLTAFLKNSNCRVITF
jgi:hypothetical protein